MASQASRSRLFPARSRKSYRLEMEGRTLYLLLSLMALTGLVIFYLGVVTGKALRDPNAPVALSAQMGTPGAGESQATPSPESLAFSEAVKEDAATVEGLRVEGEDASRRTEALLSEAEQQLELEEVPPEKTAATPNAAPPAREPAAAPQAPAGPRVTKPAAPAPVDEGTYTVQVFSSQRQQNARQLMNKLQGMGFAAYLNRYEAADKQVWYRVRVGRTSRAEAEELRARLKAEAKLKNPQIQKL